MKYAYNTEKNVQSLKKAKIAGNACKMHSYDIYVKKISDLKNYIFEHDVNIIITLNKINYKFF